MLKQSLLVGLLILILVNMSFALKFDLKPREEKQENKYLPAISGYIQVVLNAGGGRTLEAVEFGDVFIGAAGNLEGGVSYKTEVNLKDAATSGAISLGEVYLDVPNLIGAGNVFRFGRFRIPFGEAMFLPSSEKPDIFGPYYTRACFFSEYDFGLQNFSKIKEGSYELALVNGEGSSADSSKSKDFAGRYIISGKELELGLSEYLGNYGGKNRNNFNLFIKAKQGSLTGVFEYVNGTDMTGTNRTLDFYNVITQKMSPLLESVFVYESWDPNIDITGDSILSYSLGLNYFKTKDVRFSSLARLQKAETASDYSKSILSMVQVEF